MSFCSVCQRVAVGPVPIRFALTGAVERLAFRSLGHDSQEVGPPADRKDASGGVLGLSWWQVG